MNVALLVIVYMLNTGEVRNKTIPMESIEACRKALSELTRELPAGMRDGAVMCLDIKLDPLRGSRGA
jgi:hypothetical protein